MELHAHLAEIVYLNIDNLIGQTEFGNTILQHSANFVKCLEYMYVKAVLGHFASETQTGRTRTDNRYFDAVLRCHIRQCDTIAFTFIIGGETLKITYGHSRFVHLEMDTFAFTLFLLGAYAATYGGQSRGLFQHLGCSEEFAALYILDE